MGDQRTGLETILDAVGGRVLKWLPDEASPFTNDAIARAYDYIIDTVDSLDGHPGDILDCRAE